VDDNTPLDDRLPYQTRPLVFPNGVSVEEFIIPDEDKEIVLAQLYPFSPIPKLNDTLYDMHADKTFLVKDFRVTWEHGMNYLVSPYYPESGGTVIDWVDEAWGSGAESEADEFQEINASEEFEDLDELHKLDDDPDDHQLPF
jgi:hypothetical protein